MNKTAAVMSVLLTLSGWTVWMTASHSAQDASAEPVPVLVELFTSEGCSSCPPADRLLAELQRQQPVQGVEVIALGQHVDYWDRLGWKDRFSDAAFTDRQRRYARRLGASSVYTPQMVVDGRVEFVGSNQARALLEIRRSAQEPKGRLRIQVEQSPSAAQGPLELNIRLEGLPDWCRKRAELFLALVEDSLSTEVARGENRGRHLTHEAVVRRLERLAKVSLPLDQPLEQSAEVELTAEWNRPHLRAVAFVQDSSGRIAAVTSVPLS